MSIPTKPNARLRKICFEIIADGVHLGKTDAQIVAYLAAKGVRYTAQDGIFTYQGLVTRNKRTNPGGRTENGIEDYYAATAFQENP